MKKICIIITLVCSYINLFSQNVLNTTGNVGIGTLAPSSFLNIVGNSSTIPELRIDHYYNNFGAATEQYRRARGTQSTPTILLNNDYIMSVEGWGYTGSSFLRSTYIASQVNGTPTVQGVPTDLIFATSSGEVDAVEGMRLDKNGNLGIGTVSPKERLSVNGKIRAKEIKVETTNWPDYVFAKDYKLPSLDETEQHIKEKGHLPGIPSAEEVKTNGVDLGEMNAKLLKKIEELTLHLINQEKEITEQKQKIDQDRASFKKEIENLKQLIASERASK